MKNGGGTRFLLYIDFHISRYPIIDDFVGRRRWGWSIVFTTLREIVAEMRKKVQESTGEARRKRKRYRIPGSIRVVRRGVGGGSISVAIRRNRFMA